MFLLENVRVRQQLNEVDGKLKIANGDLEETSDKYAHIKEEYEQIEGQIEALDQAIETARSTLTDTGVMRSKLEGEINVLKEQIHSAEGNEEHLQSRISSIQEQINERTTEKDKILTDKNEIDGKLEQLETARAEARQLWKKHKEGSRSSIIISRAVKIRLSMRLITALRSNPSWDGMTPCWSRSISVRRN